jgi:hypothetical protein
MSSINIALNQNEAHKSKECHLCKRKFPQTILNIEGAIHHRTPATCLDKKSCRRAQRKIKTRSKK